MLLKSSVIILLLLACLSGCEQKLTQEEWELRFKPTDPNQGEAMAILRERTIAAESKAESLIMINRFKMACAAGFVASIVAVGIGVWLRIKSAYVLGCISVIACLSGYGLMLADINYGKYLGLGGLMLGLIILVCINFRVIAQGMLEVRTCLMQSLKLMPRCFTQFILSIQMHTKKCQKI